MKIYTLFFVIFFTVAGARAQTLQRDFSLAQNASIEIVNFYGRVEISADEAKKTENDVDGEETEKTDETKKSGKTAQTEKAFLSAENAREADLKITAEANRLQIVVQPADPKSRVDLILKIPEQMRVRVETGAGEIRISGNLASADAKTETGTISTNVSLENLKYDFTWTESRPRFLSDVELKKVKEKAGGKFVLNGRISADAGKEKAESLDENESGMNDGEEQSPANKKQKNKGRKPNDKRQVSLNFTTARGIILLNVPLNEVSPDLHERPLTEAAKAVIRSGDGILTEAIRRASPKYFGEYARTLPPFRVEPTLRQKEKAPGDLPDARVKQVIARVTDLNNRAVAGLRAADFDVAENGEQREVLSVESATAPFNLVLLLDVSGSIDNYVDFIRKAARQFVETAGTNDRIAIVIFNEDVKTLSTFTTDKGKLSQSLDNFDAGGGTAFYDAIAYALTDTLRPLKGERTAIVALTDGDDNRSFLPFASLLGSIQESGALVYPLYVPSALIAASAQNPKVAIDPVRNRYMSLTTKAEGEGEKLASVSGGVYYPISQLNQIQKAYEDIVVQLRTAYTVTFRSNLQEKRGPENRASPRLKIKIKRENTFVKLGSVVEVSRNNFPQSTPFAQREDKNFGKVVFAHSVSTSFSEVQNLSQNNFYLFARFAPVRETAFQNPNEIFGEIEHVNYKQFVNDNLRETKLETPDMNNSSDVFLLADGAEKIAVSRWILPKHTILQSGNDIKDGLLKMMVYTNLKNVRVGKTPVKEKSVLHLTSSKLIGSINSDSSETDATKFFQANSLNISQINLINKLFQEVRKNRFR